MMITRIALAMGGIVLLAANINTIIEAGPGYGTPAAWLLIAMGVGVAVSAIGLPIALRRMPVAAWVLIAAIMGGEGYLLLDTATRAIREQAAQRQPALAQIANHRKAEATAAAAELALARLTSTPRLDAALAAQAAAANAVAESAAKRGCARNCRKLLEAQVSATTADVMDARADLAQQRADAQRRRDQARAALLALPPAPVAIDPAAEALGVAPWMIDVAFAVLKSVGVNLMAIALMYMAGHMHTAQAAAVPLVADRDAVAGWALKQCARSPDGRLHLRDARRLYVDHCERSGRAPCPPAAFAEEMAALVRSAGLAVSRDATGDVVIHGLAVNDNLKLIAA